MTVEQKDLQSFFFDDYQIILIPVSGYEGDMYLLKEDAYQTHCTCRVSIEQVEDVLDAESPLPVAQRLNITFFTDAKMSVEYFVEHGEAPFNEQVNNILLECEDREIDPPYRKILSWVKLTGKEDVPAPQVVIPEEWDAYQGEMGIRNL